LTGLIPANLLVDIPAGIRHQIFQIQIGVDHVAELFELTGDAGGPEPVDIGHAFVTQVAEASGDAARRSSPYWK